MNRFRIALIILSQLFLFIVAGSSFALNKPSGRAIIIEVGPGMVRAGFAGDDNPRVMFPAAVTYAADGNLALIGEKASKSKADAVYPVDGKGIVDWIGVKALYSDAFKKLGTSPDGKTILTAMQASESKSNREALMKMFFDDFNAGAFYLSNASVLALYASGRTTGIVLTSEGDTVSAVPVNEGFIVPEAVTLAKAEGYHKDARPLIQAINKCNPEIRRNLYANIVLAGTGTLDKSYPVVMQIVADAVVPEKMRAKVIAPPERAISLWIGGSILSSLSTFDEMWVTREAYKKHGAGIVHTHCK